MRRQIRRCSPCVERATSDSPAVRPVPACRRCLPLSTTPAAATAARALWGMPRSSSSERHQRPQREPARRGQPAGSGLDPSSRAVKAGEGSSATATAAGLTTPPRRGGRAGSRRRAATTARRQPSSAGSFAGSARSLGLVGHFSATTRGPISSLQAARPAAHERVSRRRPPASRAPAATAGHQSSADPLVDRSRHQAVGAGRR